jgi:hypothetical protein
MTERLPTVAETVAKIKSRAFWEIIIRPSKFDKERIKSLSDCKELIEESRVEFRGWDYPHISNKYGVRSDVDWVENLTDWSDHIEYWRMYRSAQFYHLFGCWEDWWGNVRIFWSKQQYTTPGYALSFMCTLYTFTEIYEFAARYAKKKMFDDLLSLSITLNGMKNRRLVTLEVNRYLEPDYVCSIDKIPLNRTMAIDEIIGKNKEFAIDDTLHVLECFNWFKPPRKVFEEEQDKFMKGNFWSE